MNGTISTLVLMSMKFISVVGDGTIAGGNLIVSASDFTDDFGNAVTTFPTYSYYNLYINGVLQPNGVATVSAGGVIIVDGATLHPADPITLELVSLHLFPPSSMAVFTTGPILNTGPNQAVMYTMLISNDDLVTYAIVEFELFEVINNPIGAPKIPIAHQLFSVAPLSSIWRTLNITGIAAWEAQFRVMGNNVIINSYSSDTNGDIQSSVLQRQGATLAPLTPMP